MQKKAESLRQTGISIRNRGASGRLARGCQQVLSAKWLGGLVLAWILLVATGMVALWGYAQIPGEQQTAPVIWPVTSAIPRPQIKPALLLFAHPHCPCTRASLRELERFLFRFGDLVDAYVIFDVMPEADSEKQANGLISLASSIPGVNLFCDVGHAESQLFNARTSGIVFLFSCDGVLLFQGGITSSRGHEGANDGVRSLESILLNQGPALTRTPVFGCPLVDQPSPNDHPSPNGNPGS